MTEFNEDCSECGISMKIIRREKELPECDMDDMTEGQMADYMAAEMSGAYGEWEIDVVTYKCPKCGKIEIVEYI